MKQIYNLTYKRSWRRGFVLILRSAVLLLTFALLPLLSMAASETLGGENFFQGVIVTGKVSDENGSVLPGVNIIEKGTTNGTVTDADGTYRITVATSESVLVFSFVGTVSQQIPVANRNLIDVQLLSDEATLSEVVVVGYGTQQKRDVTGAVTSVTNEQFNRGIINSPEQLLQGKVAGVNVVSASGEPGANQAITIRGPGGVRTGSTPLFVVDGMALDNSTTGGSTNPLNFLNPQDIETIDVLKDASATAIYGARGANGVVLITTRKGKAGAASLNYSAGIGLSTLARSLDVFSAAEFRSAVTSVGGVLEDSLASTDWQDEITRTALTQNHNVTLSGGTEKLTYYASLGLQDQEGIIKNSEMKRYSGRININQKFLNDRLSIDLNLNASQTINNRPPSEGNNGASITIIGQAITANPTFPAREADGSPFLYNNGTNPLRSLELNKDITTINRVLGNISPSFKILPNLEYKLNLGVDNSNSVRDLQSLPSTIPPQDGRLETSYVRNNNSLIENYLTFTFTKPDHDLTAMAGHSYQKIFFQNRSYSINRFPISDIEPIYNPGIGQDLTLANNRPTGQAFINELQSFFARVTYGFKDKYLLTATVRADGSSKFGANNKYGTFPSFSLGWRVSEEEFMASLPFSTLKLRAGWGLTGNQEIESKITQPLFQATVTGTTSYPLGPSSSYPAGIAFVRLANPDIKWEVSAQTNIGLDFGLLQDGIIGSIDVFKKVSNDILLAIIPADPVQPAQTYWTNVEDMTITNQGLELALEYRGKTANGLSYGIGGNTTFIRNKVENSPYSVIPSGAASGSGLTSATINGYINGEPIGTFFLREHIGFDQNGVSIYRDVNGDGLSNDKDRMAMGSALPSTMYNFFGNIGFKALDLTINFNGVSGNKVYDNTANSNFYKNKISKSVNTTPAAIASPEESINNAAPVSSRYLKDGAFLRLNNLSLGYRINPASIGLGNWVTSIRLSVTGQNLWLITDYDGYDPEVNTDRTIDRVLSYGIDYLSYPKARTLLFGLNVSF